MSLTQSFKISQFTKGYLENFRPETLVKENRIYVYKSKGIDKFTNHFQVLHWTTFDNCNYNSFSFDFDLDMFHSYFVMLNSHV